MNYEDYMYPIVSLIKNCQISIIKIVKKMPITDQKVPQITAKTNNHLLLSLQTTNSSATAACNGSSSCEIALKT